MTKYLKTLENNNLMPQPTVSIILATFNREKYLREAIVSALEQTYHDFELIVIDDGSTDNTKKMISAFRDPRLIYVYQENKGRSIARNVALNMAKGQYIAFLDSDDLYLPEKLALQVQYLDSNPHVGMIYTSAYCINGEGNFIPHKYKTTISGSIYKKIAFFRPVTITLPIVMVRREIIDAVGEFDEKMDRFEDTDMWRRISKITHIEAINTYTCKLRTHVGNNFLAQNPEQLFNALHYYAQKILREDGEKSLLIRYQGLSRLYLYYARAMKTVPKWKSWRRKLLDIAHHYRALHKGSGTSDVFIAKFWKNVKLLWFKQENEST